MASFRCRAFELPFALVSTHEIFAPLSAALSLRAEELVERWAKRYAASPMRVPDPAAASALAAQVAGLIDHLRCALPAAGEPPALEPGAVAVRELERGVAFLGATSAATTGSGFDVGAALLSLRDVLLQELQAADARTAVSVLFDWLVVLALDSYSAAGAKAADERQLERLENGIQILRIAPELPALIMLGELDGRTLDTLFGRLLLMVVRVDARAVIVDVAGVPDTVVPGLLTAASGLFQHPKLAAVEALIVGATEPSHPQWNDAARGCAIVHFDRFDDAVARGLECCGYDLHRRR